MKCWDGLASHPGGVAILLVASCYRNRDKLWQPTHERTRLEKHNLPTTSPTVLDSLRMTFTANGQKLNFCHLLLVFCTLDRV